jgi:hypothetical protein
VGCLGIVMWVEEGGRRADFDYQSCHIANLVILK